MTRVLGHIRWYKNRLAAMSAAEIIWRLLEALKRKTDRITAKKLIAPLRDYGALPEIPGLRAGIEGWNIPEKLLHQWEQDARKALKGEHFIFGQSWPSCAQKDIWHLDPLSKTLWPHDVFCFAINYRLTSKKGDIKYVWELNRLQYLQPVAALACKRKDKALAQLCLDHIESWIDHNPPFLGVNWNSGIELSLRVISILTVTTLVGEHLSREARGKIWASLRTHARWIARYPSLYSSANNHLTAEGLGLFTIGALCPHFPEAEEWRKTGWNILCDAAIHQILPDGAGAEQAIAYTASVMETLLAGLKIAQSRHMAIPDFYVRKLVLGGEYLRWLSDTAGNLPHIGDDDNACVFGDYHSGDHYAASVLASVAAASNRADLTPSHIEPHFRQAIFGSAPLSDFAPFGTRCFAHGGMTVGRHKSAAGDIMLAFDHGYLGYLSIAAHGHADALALWLHIGDQPIFVDAGTYLYHAEHEERRHFRGTAAHNTLAVEGADSSTMSGNFNWSRKANVSLRSFTSRGDFWQIEAEHDGYVENFQTIHRRTLSLSPASGGVIEDMLFAPSARHVSIAFLLHPALTARREGNEIAILKGEQLLLRLRHEGGLEPTIGLPGTAESGWYSREFGIKQAATRIIFKGVLSPEHKAATHFFWAV